MAKYVFPAIFVKEEAGYSISFPDVPGCYTSAQTIAEGIERAQDVLCLTLFDMEEDAEVISDPSAIEDIHCSEDAFATMIFCDTLEYRKYFDNKAVKKTLSIPNWLNTLAEREGVNFSYILQVALKERLGLQ